ncbi:hypothetical protein AB0950_40350 [Streptomyces sp. NPDC007189]|uniref:hypothetical protein n=1 Tax=Streptomyces sp. NPDC007189 TaxID=3154315 RepID=UPI0034553A93
MSNDLGVHQSQAGENLLRGQAVLADRAERDHQRDAAGAGHEMAFAAIDLLPWAVATAFFPDGRGRSA